jgi:hypothetical protein
MESQKLKNGQKVSKEQYLELIGKPAKNKGHSKRAQLKEIPNKKNMSSLEFNEQIIIQSQPKKSKFNAKVVWIDGIRFDSTWEGKRYSQLKLLERTGHISNLQMQVPYPMEINNVVICKYLADFVYVKKEIVIVEDAKGFITPEYRIKKKLMKAIHNIEILETRSSNKIN